MPHDSQEIETVNPASGEPLARYAIETPARIEAALDAAERACQPWRRVGYDGRAEVLRRVSALFRERKAALAELAACEMGKPIAQGLAEIEKCAWALSHFADAAADVLADEVVDIGVADSRVTYEPLGPLLSITPWNYPFWQIVRFAAGALAIGNVVVLKHAPSVTGAGLAVEKLFAEAGAPAGVFQTLVLTNAQAQRVISDWRIRGVGFTGGGRGGASVAAAAGAALKKCVLELGGSDPFIVLADADIAKAAEAGARSRFQNAGQACLAAKRFIVESAVFDDFVAAFVEAAKAYAPGDPLSAQTLLGPMARGDLRAELERQRQVSLAFGASEALAGGSLSDLPGFFFAPSVLVHPSPDSPAAVEEMFGPVAAILRADSLGQALALANDTPYGLTASIWTEDMQRARSFAALIEAGGVFVNAVPSSDPRLPFGGVKASGFGRELGTVGLKEFANAKTFVAA
jgi:succinate-semialdehyde dehydrogenase/glutarate-semialdehyde dehydrogenase